MARNSDDSLISPSVGVAVETVSQRASNSAISIVHPAGAKHRDPTDVGIVTDVRHYADARHSFFTMGGIFVVEPFAKTGIHHHGEQETVAYVLEGEATVRWGDFGEHATLIGAGNFFMCRVGYHIRN